jgi:hypothetical protein
MSKLGDLFTQAGVEKDQLLKIVGLLKENPMAAMAAVQELNLPPETIQKVMGLVMTDPGCIEEMALDLGLGGEDLDLIKKQMQQPEA